MFLLLSSSIKVLNIEETGEFSSKQHTPNCTLGLSGLCFMMKDEDWFKFKALKMSLLVDSEVVVVRMIERALLVVSDLNSSRFPYQIQKRTTCTLRKIQEDPTGLYDGLHQQLSPPETSNGVQLNEAYAIFSGDANK